MFSLRGIMSSHRRSGRDATAAVLPELLSKPRRAPGIRITWRFRLRSRTSREHPVGQLFILRSLAGARQRLGALRRQILALWLLALMAALAVTYLVARKIMQPVAELDRAAAEIAKQNYDYRDQRS